MQLDQEARGFSFSKEGPLDMRMDPTRDLTAADIVNLWPEDKLGELFRDLGEERSWKKAAAAIVQAREKGPFVTTSDLSRCLIKALGRGSKRKLHPATLVFQALRIFVNQELEVIAKALPKAIASLARGGRIGVMSFHSLEDRIVKNFFRQAATVPAQNKYREFIQEPLLKLVSKKPMIARKEEVRSNPRSRSAKLRFVEKVER